MRKLAFPTITTLLFSIGLLVTSNGLVHAQSETKVGVTVSAVINADPSVGIRVSAAMGKALSETLTAEVLAGDAAQARLPDSARSETCLGESSCLVNAGKQLGVDQLLMLIIVGVGDEIKIEATWANVQTGDTALRPGITVADNEEALLAAFSAHGQELLPDIALRPGVTPATTVDDNTVTGNTGASTTDGSVTVTETTSTTTANSSKGTAKLLMLGGAVVLAGWGGYGLYQAIDCGGFTCPEGEYDSGRDGAIDLIAGGIGTVAFSAGLYLYLTSDDKAERQVGPAPVSVNVSSRSLGLSLGGSF